MYPLYFILLLFSLVSCRDALKPFGNLPPTHEIRLGEISSMTGSESTFGLSVHKGILMAVEEANAAGGIHGKKIKLVLYDTQSRADETVRAVTRLIEEDKVHLVLGEVASDLSLAAAPICQKNSVPMISPASTHPQITQAGNYIFRSCFIEPFQGSVMAKFALNYLNLKKAAILQDEKSEYSTTLASFFSDDYTKLGGEVLIDLSYQNGQKDFTEALAKIKEKKPDLLFVPGYYQEVSAISVQARKMGIKAVLLGGDGWDSGKLTEIGQGAILGSYFSNHFSALDQSPVVQSFVEKFHTKFSEAPNALSALGYDATRLAIDAIQQSKDLKRSSIKEALSKTKNFQGVTGLISINQDRNAIKPAVVLKVGPSGKNTYEATISP
jgi:branched-chain amino acid transport system substrate-binding protein